MTEGSPLAGAAPAAPRRPIAITIICVIGLIGALITLPLLFSDAVARVARSAPWYPVLLAASAVTGLACMIGLWQMRRWAVYVYTAMFAVTQIVFVVSRLWTPTSLIAPAIVIVIMFIYLPKMR